MIITPSCLLVPLTHVIGQTRYNNQKFFSKPLKGGLAHIILQAVTWTLFSVAVIILGVAIFWHPTMFGLISSAAMLGIFAQGLMVTSILTFEEDSDPSDSSPTSSRSASFDKDEDDSSPDHLIKASQWAKSPVRKRSDSFAHKKKKRRKRDFFLWCMMNYALFQVPFVLKWFYKTVIHTCVDCATGVQNIRDIPAMFTLVATLGIPLFTHGVGGLLFHKDKWSFHHPMSGGKLHVLSQAAGWTLVSLAGILQITNLFFDTHYDFLLHSGNVVGWCAEALLLYSLLNYKDKVDVDASDFIPPRERGNSKRGPFEFLFAVGQDIFITNVHWLFIGWIAAAPMGFDLFSLNPTAKMFNVTPLESALNFLKVMVACVIPSLFFPYSATRKPISIFNPFALLIKINETILLSPFGIFRDSMIEMEDPIESYQKDGCMFAIAPHGTLPLSVWAVWHQASHIFDEVCLFFGSQVALVPFYRLWTGARGGCMTITKKNLLSVMKTRQNVALVPGGVSEMMKCEPLAKNINVSIKHKGFVRIAIQEGFDLVPILMMHENDMYLNPMRDFQGWCYKKFKVPMGLPYYTNKWYLPVSNQKPLRVVLGKRIKVDKMENPTQKAVDKLHRQFYEEVVRCWAKHKNDFGYGDRELVYVE
ncbi:hypothetical protein TrCOL_g6013 [Triparma columacea]|uniref:Acyltransferase n=1 Tax=Triparma columacea TaxID=722753 RepID=A0A9W7G8Q2_9STRA|nr:hypothetical protein TrCOL_g6013 [Triparma columacea]